jgi:thiamine-phosphate pyrophosphorylase
LAELAIRYTTPLSGIGGITAKNAGAVIQAGAIGVAVITAVVSAKDIAAATRELGTALFEPQRSE